MRMEHWFYTVPLRLRSLFRRRQVEQELDEEFQYHLHRKTEQYMAEGLTPDEARHAAMRDIGGLQRRKEECRDMRRLNVVDNLVQDLRYAGRMLTKSPSFAMVAILSLALAIGANAAIFSLIDSLLLRRLPVSDPERLVNVFIRGEQPRAYFTYPLFEAIRKRNDVFSATFAWSEHDLQTAGGGDVVHVPGVLVSGDYFPALGIAASVGRTFTAADDRPDGGANGPGAIISDSFWSRQFQRNPTAVGRTIVLDKVHFTIVGVMPRGFFGAQVGTAPEIWAPLQLASRIDDPECITSRSCWWLVIMARLKPGISEEQAAAQLRVISSGIMKDTLPPAWNSIGQSQTYLHMELGVGPGAAGWTDLRTQFSHPLQILMILVGLVLLIACSNMTNLLLARSSARHREIAIRLAMGARRARVMRQLLTESVFISIIGAAVGFLFARWATRLLVSFLSTRSNPVLLNLDPDWRVLLFTAAAAIGTGMLFGLIPAFQTTRFGISAALKERAHNVRRAGAGMAIGRMLLAGQVALSILLVAGAGLFAGSLVHLISLNPGFNPKNLILIGLDTDKRPEKGAALVGLYGRLLQRVNGIAGVRSASLTMVMPLSNGGWSEDVAIPGTQQRSEMYINMIAPRFFETMAMPLVAGREFAASDTDTGEKVCIIDENAARAWFAGKNPVGEHIQLNNKSIFRIVGVVGNAKYLNLREPEPRTLYLTYSQADPGSMKFAIRTDTALSSVYAAFRAALHEIAPGTPISQVKSMTEQVGESLRRERLMASLSIFFGVLALLLTSIGLYGILAYAVTRRTGEIGIRMALGAQRHNVIWLVVRETLRHVAIGAVAGVGAVLVTSHLIASFLYGVRPNDPLTIAVAVFTLASVAAAAAYLPARRASRLDPMTALREE